MFQSVYLLCYACHCRVCLSVHSAWKSIFKPETTQGSGAVKHRRAQKTSVAGLEGVCTLPKPTALSSSKFLLKEELNVHSHGPLLHK